MNDLPESGQNPPESPVTQESNAAKDGWLNSPETTSESQEVASPPTQPTIQPPASPSGDFSANAPSPQNPNQFITPTQQKEGSGGFRIFMIFSVILIVIIYSAVTYLYLQNKKMKGGSTTENNQEAQATVTPTPVFNPDQIKIRNGNIVREMPDGEAQILIDKEKYESTGITGFIKVKVSPDLAKMCFESWPPAPEPALYIANIDGSGVIEASPNRQNCLWSGDSRKVYYVNSSSKTTPTNIYSFDIETKTESDLTGASVPKGTIRKYEIVGLSADNSKLICKYEDVTSSTTTATGNECEIDLQTSEVTSL